MTRQELLDQLLVERFGTPVVHDYRPTVDELVAAAERNDLLDRRHTLRAVSEAS